MTGPAAGGIPAHPANNVDNSAGNSVGNSAAQKKHFAHHLRHASHRTRNFFTIKIRPSGNYSHSAIN
jgi:hypothetical protein